MVGSGNEALIEMQQNSLRVRHENRLSKLLARRFGSFRSGCLSKLPIVTKLLFRVALLKRLA